MAKTCAICGKGSGMYPLCISCFRLRDAGKIEKCEECGTWHYTDKPCKCTPQKEATQSKVTTVEEPEIETRISKNDSMTVELKIESCIVCQEPTDDNQFFCKSCYFKYRNKNLLIKVSKCKTAELLDASYEGLYTCKDGHIVKSMAEYAIDNYLFDEKITHSYEPSVSIDLNSEHDLHPDFYLPEKDIYIEHWGFDETHKKYTEQKKYKIEQYKKLKLTVVCTTQKDMSNIQAALNRKLKFFKRDEINE